MSVSKLTTANIVQPTKLIEKAELAGLKRVIEADVFRLILVYAADFSLCTPEVPWDAMTFQLIGNALDARFREIFKHFKCFSDHRFRNNEPSSNVTPDEIRSLYESLDYLDDPDFPEIQAVISSNREKGMAPLLLAVVATEFYVENYEQPLYDKDLFTVFVSIVATSGHLDPGLEAALQNFRPLPLHERAVAISSWMEQNRDLLAQIEQLNLTSHCLSFLPIEIENLTGLKKLSLAYNIGLKRICCDLARMPLTGLDLAHTQVECDFSKLPGLQKLSFTPHKRPVPLSLGSLQNLEELDLRDGTLTRIPDFLLELVNLRKLNLTNNDIQRLPDLKRKLPRLELIDLTGNLDLSPADVPTSFKTRGNLTIRITAEPIQNECCTIL